MANCCIVQLLHRARRSEARIQQMVWKVNYSDIVFMNTVCLSLLLANVFSWLDLQILHCSCSASDNRDGYCTVLSLILVAVSVPTVWELKLFATDNHQAQSATY